MICVSILNKLCKLLLKSPKGCPRNFGAKQMVRLSAQFEEKVRRGEFQGLQKNLLRIESAADILSMDLSKQKNVRVNKDF